MKCRSLRLNACTTTKALALPVAISLHGIVVLVRAATDCATTALGWTTKDGEHFCQKVIRH